MKILQRSLLIPGGQYVGFLGADFSSRISILAFPRHPVTVQLHGGYISFHPVFLICLLCSSFRRQVIKAGVFRPTVKEHCANCTMYKIVPLHGRPCLRGSRFFISSVRRRSKADDTGSISKASKDIEKKTLPNSDSQKPLHLWQRLGPVTKAFYGYGRAQATRPYVTQVVTSVVIYFCGDLGAQKIGEDAYDPWRAARNMIIGAVVSIPAYRWYCSAPYPTYNGAKKHAGSCTLAALSITPPSSSQ
jgi:hypothetical protein